MGDVFALPQAGPREWGARVDYDSWLPTSKDSTVVHWVGVGSTQKGLLPAHDRCLMLLRSIERHHIDGNGWSGIGYNMAVCPHGTLFRLRGAARGAHNPGDSDGDGRPDNVDALGVLMMVGEGDTPTPASLQQLQRVCDTQDGPVFSHRHSRRTDCPGDFLHSWVERYTEGEPDEEDEVRTLRVGDEGPDVMMVQASLNAWRADADLAVDGIFGEDTKRWTRLFQRNGPGVLVEYPEGLVDWATWEHLMRLTRPKGAAPEEHEHEAVVKVVLT